MIPHFLLRNINLKTNILLLLLNYDIINFNILSKILYTELNETVKLYLPWITFNLYTIDDFLCIKI